MVLSKLAKILSEDEHLLINKIKLIDALGIPGGNVTSVVKRFDLGHATAYELMREILTEWVKIRRDSATMGELRRILKEDNFNRIADQLQKIKEIHQGPIPTLESTTRNEEPPAHSSRNPPKSDPIIFGVKNVVLNFIGRQEELEKLNEYFHSGEWHIVCISGLGGIGKTELAKKFALNISSPRGDTQIAKSWLSGETPQTLLNSCSKLCHHLGLSATDAEGKPLRMEAMLENIVAKLNYSRWLVIIDNVDEIHEEFQEALKILCGFGPDVFILVTSRRRDIFPGELELLEVNPLKLEDSVQFVRKSLKIEDNSSEDAINSLCLQLGNFPLALGQAVAYIKQQQSISTKGRAYNIQNYLDDLTKTETLGLDKDRRLAEYSTATLKVWNITLDKILDVYGAEGNTALDLLDVIAFINPDDIRINSLVKLFNRFYKNYFQNADDGEAASLNEKECCCEIFNRFYTKCPEDSEAEDSENETEDAESSDEGATRNQIECGVTLLLQYSLISSFDCVLSIHRLVQLALRVRMTSKSSTVSKIKDLEMLTTFWNSFIRHEWNRAEMPNILTIWNHSKTRRDLKSHIADKTAYVYFQLRDLGMVNECHNFALECCGFLLSHYGSEGEVYLLMEQNLAMAMSDKGQYEESLAKLTFLHEQFKNLYGEDSPYTLAAMHNITHVLHSLRRFEDCLEWCQRALMSKIRILGENNDSTITTKNLMALTLLHLGRRTEALELLYELLIRQKVNLGKHHPKTLATRHNIATCLFKKENYAEALGLFQDVLPRQEEHRGVDHPHTLITKAWMADTLYRMGDEAKALEMWEEVLTTTEKVLGPLHPDTIRAREAVIYLKKKINLAN